MPWSPSATAELVEAIFRANLADVAITAAETYLPKALYDAFAQSFAVSSGGHSLGTNVPWTNGNGVGQYAIGAANPNATTFTIQGCDEAGSIAYTAGTGTSNGILFQINFAVAFPSEGGGSIVPGNQNAAALFFGSHWWIETTANYIRLHVATTNLTNLPYKFYWVKKGST